MIARPAAAVLAGIAAARSDATAPGFPADAIRLESPAQYARTDGPHALRMFVNTATIPSHALMVMP